MRKKWKYVLLTSMLYLSLIFISGCATGRASFRKAETLKNEEKYTEAIRFYMEAVRKNPKEPRFRLRLMEAVTEASNYFYRKALEYKQQQNYPLAIIEINKALEYNPSNNIILAEKKTLMRLASPGAPKEEKTWLQKIKTKTSMERRLLKKADEEKLNLEFSKKVDLSEIFNSLGKISDINIIFDSGFKNTKMAISLKNITFTQALDRLCLLNNLYYELLDPSTLIIIPDTPAKRKSYERQIIKNYYLSNMKADDCAKIIGKIAKVTNLIPDPINNMITVRDTAEKVALVEKLIGFYDKRKAEVLVKVDIMEVNKDKLSEYGVEFSQYQVGQSLVSPDSTGIPGNRFYYLDSSDFRFTVPSVVYKLLESDSDSKVIARPQFRGEDGEKIQIKLGDKVPYPKTSFVPYSTGGLDQQPITSYDLQEVGIEITITPQVHHNGEISLDLDFKLSFITSAGTSTLPPTIGNRSVKTRIRLRDGETGIMAGLLRDSESSSKKGFPGLMHLPILGNIFSSNRKQVGQTDIILRVTPFIIRMPDITEEDLSPIESGTEENIRLKK